MSECLVAFLTWWSFTTADEEKPSVGVRLRGGSMRSSPGLLYKLSLPLSPYTHTYTFIPSLIKEHQKSVFDYVPIFSSGFSLLWSSPVLPPPPPQNSTSITLTQENQDCCSSSLKLHNRELNTTQETFTTQTDIQVNSPFPLFHIYLIVSLTQILDSNKSFSLSHCIPTLNAKNNYIISRLTPTVNQVVGFVLQKTAISTLIFIISLCKTHCCSVSIIWLRKKKNVLIE